MSGHDGSHTGQGRCDEIAAKPRSIVSALLKVQAAIQAKENYVCMREELEDEAAQ